MPRTPPRPEPFPLDVATPTRIHTMPATTTFRTELRAVLRLLWLCLLPSVMAACDRGDHDQGNEAPASGLEALLQETPVIESMASQPWRWSIQSTFTREDGLPAIEGPGALALTGDGTLFLLDVSNRALYRAAPSAEGVGATLTNWEPPEGIRPRSMAVVGDHLALLDGTVGRIFVLTSEGVTEEAWPAESASGPADLFRLYPAGREFYELGVAEIEDTVDRAFHRYTSSGPTEERVPFPTYPDAPNNFTICRFTGGFGEIGIPFAPALLRAPGPGGRMAVARTDRYRVAIMGRDGRAQFVIHGQAPEPLPVTDAEWNAATRDYREFRERRPAARCNPEFPEQDTAVYPTLHSITFDAIGRIWIELRIEEGTRFDVFSGNGEALGHLTLPVIRRGSIPPFIDERSLTLVTLDDDAEDRLMVIAFER